MIPPFILNLPSIEECSNNLFRETIVGIVRGSGIDQMRKNVANFIADNCTPQVTLVISQ
jgi:hypothetical protein